MEEPIIIPETQDKQQQKKMQDLKAIEQFRQDIKKDDERSESNTTEDPDDIYLVDYRGAPLSDPEDDDDFSYEPYPYGINMNMTPDHQNITWGRKRLT